MSWSQSCPNQLDRTIRDRRGLRYEAHPESDWCFSTDPATQSKVRAHHAGRTPDSRFQLRLADTEKYQQTSSKWGQSHIFASIRHKIHKVCWFLCSRGCHAGWWCVIDAWSWGGGCRGMFLHYWSPCPRSLPWRGSWCRAACRRFRKSPADRRIVRGCLRRLSLVPARGLGWALRWGSLWPSSRWLWPLVRGWRRGLRGCRDIRRCSSYRKCDKIEDCILF